LSLTNYEKRSLFRFLTLYLGSVFILLSIIGWLFFNKNVSMLKSSIKFEMLYEVQNIQSQIIHKFINGEIDPNIIKTLKSIKSNRFKVGFFGPNGAVIYSQFGKNPGFSESFYLGDDACYSKIEGPFKTLGIKYIVLKEDILKKEIEELKLKIIGYLLLSFIFMATMGYFLSKLFLKPIREKIESLNRFIEETTHELNTPISAILMTISQLKGVEPQKLNRLKASAKRLSTMYSSLSYALEAKDKNSKKEKLNLEEIVRDRVEFAKLIATTKKIEINLDLEPCTIVMDRESIDRVIDNLLSNAIKYSMPDSKIEISLKNCILKVQDYGIGVEESEQKEIFKRYYRANKEQGGFGIGLNLVKKIVDNYGIKLELNSAKGEGSTFILDFRNR